MRVTILPWAIILTKACRAAVSIIFKGSFFIFLNFLLIKPHSCLHDFQCRYIFGFLSKCFISIFPNNCVFQQYSFICTE